MRVREGGGGVRIADGERKDKKIKSKEKSNHRKRERERESERESKRENKGVERETI